MNRTMQMRSELQCQQAAHELLRMIEPMFMLSIDPLEQDRSAAIEPDEIERFGLMIARLERVTRRIESAQGGLELRQRCAALEKLIAVKRTAANAA
jgi:hypothetical protein